MNPPFQDAKKRWWYVSQTRKQGKYKLWCGPFDSEDEVLSDQAQKEVTP